jgi:putative ABC transport system permease protein
LTISLWRMLRRSIAHRRARSLSALLALTVSAAVATALLTLYADLDAKLHHEFRGFGANIVATLPTSSGTPSIASSAMGGFTGHSLAKAQSAAGPDANLAEFAYAVATTDRGTPVVVAGVDFPAVRRLDSWWSVGAWPNAPDAALLGVRAAEFVGNEKNVTLTFAGRSQTFAGAGTVKTGGDEDSRIYVPLAAFTRWTGVAPAVLEVQVPGGEARVNAAMARLKAALPGADVEPVRQLVEGESKIVDRTHALMFAAVLLIALTVAVSVLATLSASVLERRRDFALMKALGGSEAQMMGLFLGETMLIALGGVAVGWMIGSFAAWGISELNFGTAALPLLRVLPLVLVLNGIIAALAAFFPVRSLRGLEPAALLKGD